MLNLQKTLFVLLAVVLLTPEAAADDKPEGPVYEAAVELIRQAVTVQPDQSHMIRLRGLRKLKDPALRPLFEQLIGSSYAPFQINGLLGLAQSSESGTIDLGRVIEIDDPAFVGAAVMAAIDDGSIDQEGLKTVSVWKDLDPLGTLLVLNRLQMAGDPIDIALVKRLMAVDIDNEDAGRRELLTYAYAAMLLTRAGDAEGTKALDRLFKLPGQNVSLTIYNILTHALKVEAKTLAPYALRVAKDTSQPSGLQMQALLVAMRLRAEGVEAYWNQAFEAEEDAASRARLALVALDSATHLKPEFFDPLIADQSAYLQQIGRFAKAVSMNDPAGQLTAVDPLLKTGVTQTTQWVVTYCKRDSPDNGAELLERVLRSFLIGFQKRNQDLVRISSEAALIMCDLYPDEATKRIPAMLSEPAVNSGVGNARLSVVLDGIARGQGADLKALVMQLPQDKFVTPYTRAMSLLVSAKHGIEMNQKQWEDVAALLQGAGPLAKEYRTQLAWLYLKHNGWTDAAIRDAFKP